MKETKTVNYNIDFKGKGTEFFKIYFVDFLLKIITLGIYSAWAKVRQTQYFYGNTSINGSSFEYHAKPTAILRARAIVFSLIILYFILITIYPVIDMFFTLTLLTVISFAVVLSVRFNMNNTSYKNVRFNFDGKFKESLKVFLGYGLLVVFSLGLLYPLFEYKRFKFLVNNKQFGKTNMKFEPKISRYYKIYIMTILIFTAGVFLSGFFIGAFSPMVSSLFNLPDIKMTKGVITLISLFFVFSIYALFILFTYSYTYSRLYNYMYNNTTLSNISFRANLSSRQLLYIYFTNAILILITFGLFVPFAKVRLAKYKLSCITLISPDIKEFEANNIDNNKALFEEGGDLLGYDLGL